uniref:Uncharacterized protein n=1 Tax=Glossina austeni TaxID=7395 RepID=A0A1A9UZP3_GLOAU
MSNSSQRSSLLPLLSNSDDNTNIPYADNDVADCEQTFCSANSKGTDLSITIHLHSRHNEYVSVEPYELILPLQKVNVNNSSNRLDTNCISLPANLNSCDSEKWRFHEDIQQNREHSTYQQTVSITSDKSDRSFRTFGLLVCKLEQSYVQGFLVDQNDSYNYGERKQSLGHHVRRTILT